MKCYFLIMSAFCQYPGNLFPICSEVPSTNSDRCISGHHRIRRTDTCQTSWRTVCAGGYCCIHSLKDYAPQTDVAIELGGEDAKIIYFEGGNVEQRMNGICAGGTGSFIDQMASLLQTDATGLNEYAKNYKALYTRLLHAAVYLPRQISSR